MLATLQRRSARAILSRSIDLKSACSKSLTVISTRKSSSFIDFDDDADNWPRNRVNTVINVCPQGEQMVVERLGKLSDVKEGGWFIAIPLLDTIQYVVDMREKALSIAPQSCITKDNVHVQVSGTLYCQFVDAKLAAYGSKNPIYAVKQHAQSSMRAAIGQSSMNFCVCVCVTACMCACMYACIYVYLYIFFSLALSLSLYLILTHISRALYFSLSSYLFVSYFSLPLFCTGSEVKLDVGMHIYPPI